jgi:hypothetical protein
MVGARDDFSGFQGFFSSTPEEKKLLEEPRQMSGV